MTPEQFFATNGAAARNVCHGTPLLASVCLAQAALESNWGESGLTKRAFNFFGFKVGSNWAGSVLSLPTKDQLAAKLAEAGQCCDDENCKHNHSQTTKLRKAAR